MARAKKNETVEEVETAEVEGTEPEPTEPTEPTAENATVGENASIKEAFDIAVEADKDEDSIKMDMIGAGAKFKNVTRLFNEYMIDSGLVKSKDEKNEILTKVLDGVDLTDPETFDSCVAELAEELDVNEKSAAGSLRQWAKTNKIEFYKKPKGSGSGRSGITSKIHNWIIDNPFAAEAELVAYLKEVGTENTMRHKTAYISILEMAKAIATKYSEAADIEA